MADIARPLRRIVVAGGGTAGWMAAAALATLLPALAIELVESDAIGTIGVGEATIPQIGLFNSMLGIADADLIDGAEATYKLGIEFVGWNGAGSRYLHPFGPIGEELGGVPFHQLWLRARTNGVAEPFARYSVNAAAAAAGRFGRTREVAPFSAWHFDAVLYARLLRRIAEGRGVTRHEGRIVGVEREGDGGVAALRLDGDRRIAGDLFLDCSGFRGLLLGEALGVGMEDWSRWLPCDRAIALPTASSEPPIPFTRSTAHAAGWCWRIPLQHRTGNGIVYASAAMDEADAERTLRGQVDGEPCGEPRRLSFQAGRRECFWRHNVVALGLAGGFLEPLESTSIHLIQTAISRLVTLLPATLPAAAAAAEFNRVGALEYAAIRDFLVLHYAAAERPEPFWRERAADMPDTLRQRIALWRETAHVSREPHELFSETSWIAVLLGHGIVPAGWSALADRVPEAMLVRHLAACARGVGDAVARLPAHHAYVAAQRRVPIAAAG